MCFPLMVFRPRKSKLLTRFKQRFRHLLNAEREKRRRIIPADRVSTYVREAHGRSHFRQQRFPDTLKRLPNAGSTRPAIGKADTIRK